MTCEEFLMLLDSRTAAAPPADTSWLAHAGSCPSCALALRLERSLLTAPTWAAMPTLSPERKARVFAEARSSSIFLPSTLRLLVDSAIPALLAASFLVAIVSLFPWKVLEFLPAELRDWILPSLVPFIRAWETGLAYFAPLAGHPLGAGLLLAAAFTACLAAMVSLRVLSPRRLA